MEMKKLVLVNVALLFLYICFTASNVDARSRSINPGSFIIAACNFCICTASYPPQCRCLDQTTFCYDKCDSSEDKAYSE
ncbi:hypothetical protein JHK87_026167 [Glycine soja]|nr:hypothetical protein JHK87_026167 [Glycine soja]